MGTGITDPHEALVHSQDSELNSAVLERRCLGGGWGEASTSQGTVVGWEGPSSCQWMPVWTEDSRGSGQLLSPSQSPPTQGTLGNVWRWNWGCSRHLVGRGQEMLPNTYSV